MKKILSLVLVIALVLGSFSFAFAAPADVEDANQAEAVKVLMALGVVTGFPDGTYRPEGEITRAQMAALIVRALGFGELAQGGTASFTDTKGHWAEGYISIASDIGIVLGFPDGTFKPNDALTYHQMVTMVVRALGYTDESLTGTWPTSYMLKAFDLKLLDNVSGQLGNRGNVAVMLFNALHKPLVEINENGRAVAVSPARNLIDRIGELKEGQTISYANVFGTNPLKTRVDLAPYLYQKVDYYLNAEGEVAVISKVHSKTFANTISNTSNILTNLELKDGTSTKEFPVTSSTAVFYNGTETTLGSLVADSKLAVDDEVTVVYTEANSVKTVAGLKIWKSTDILANAYVANATSLGGSATIQLPRGTDSKINTVAVTVEGDASALSEIKKDDVVHAFVSHTNLNGGPERVKLVVARQTVEGRVTEVSSDEKTVVINGVQLKDPSVVVGLVRLNTTVKVALDKDGEVFATLTATTLPANYGLVKDRVEQTGSGISFVPGKVQVVLANGETVIYNMKQGVAPPAKDLVVDLTVDTDGVVTTWSALTLPVDVNGETFNTSSRVLGGNKLLNDDTIIFYQFGTTYSTLSPSDLGTSVTGTAVMVGTSSFVRVLYLTDKGSTPTETNVYAVIKSFTNLVEGNTTVQRVTHYLDSVYPVETLTNASGLADGKLNTLVRVDINTAGRITAITPATTAQTDIFDKWTNATVTAIVGNLIQFDDGNFYSLSSDVVVYTMNAAGNSVTGVGTIDDISVDQAGQVVEAYRIGTTTGNATVKYIFIKPAQ